MLLTLEAVNTFYDKSHVLKDVSLEVDKGEVVALLGRNGSGRSTTLKTIMGVVPPKTGTIRLSGDSIQHKSPFALARRGIAFVPEDRRIFPNLTVAENLRLAALAGRRGPWTEKRIFEYFTVLGERRNTLARLSGGEQQMLALSRAFLGNPRVLLMDEISMGLAPRIVEQLFESVNELRRRGLTIVLVEQYLTYALRFADICYILAKGRIEFVGEPSELRDSEALASSYLGAG